MDRFSASEVDAFDLDSQMLERARTRLQRRGAAVRLWVGDVTAIPAPDAAYDAIFDFGIVHHVPDWRAALREVHRVLRPGGRFYAEEAPRRVLLVPLGAIALLAALAFDGMPSRVVGVESSSWVRTCADGWAV